MRKATCPQCHIPSLYLKRGDGSTLPIYVTTHGELLPKREGDTLDGCDTATLYCYGCSWSGSIAALLKKYTR